MERRSLRAGGCRERRPCHALLPLRPTPQHKWQCPRPAGLVLQAFDFEPVAWPPSLHFKRGKGANADARAGSGGFLLILYMNYAGKVPFGLLVGVSLRPHLPADNEPGLNCGFSFPSARRSPFFCFFFFSPRSPRPLSTAPIRLGSYGLSA